MLIEKRKLSFWLPFLASMLLAAPAWSKPHVLADGCEIDLTSGRTANLASQSHARQNLGNAGSYLPGDKKSMKLLDIEGRDKHALSEAIIQHLHFRDDAQVSPYLQPVIETALQIADQMGAVFSISSWVMPDDLRTIRISLDMPDGENSHLHVLRLPNLIIRDGLLAKRIDIDLTPEQLTLMEGEAQAITENDTLVVGEPASHDVGLSIDSSDALHPIIDSPSEHATVDQFIGTNARPELSLLLKVAHELIRGVFPKSQNQRFKSYGEFRAINEGHGWQISH